MIRTMLKPFLKKFLGLFISMVFVSMLSIGLLCAFGSSIINLENTLKTYIKENGNVNAFASIDFTNTADMADITDVEGVKSVEFRLTMDAFVKKSDGRTITARIFSTRDGYDSIMKRYVLERVEPYKNSINVSVVRKFAQNNNFKVGDTIKIGYFNFFIDCRINEIIETPEAIQARANNYVWSDNSDFGYIYLNEKEINRVLEFLSKNIENKVLEDEKFKPYYEAIVSSIGVTLPDILGKFEIVKNYAMVYSNQVLITAEDGYTESQVVKNVENYFKTKGIGIKSISENSKMFYYMYIQNAIKQLRVASIFLPVFFYSVTMIVIGLFINQIIKSMTPQIGVMMSIGVGHWDIISIFVAFTLLMSVVAGILGVGVGLILNQMLAKVMIITYSMPTLGQTLNPWVAAFAVVFLIVFATLATLISCKLIFTITPKDATISNEAKRKKLPAWLERFIEKAPMNTKLGVNSIAQNPRRFFVSVFSIFASFVMILLACFFYVSKEELMDQSVDRRLSFDAQVYMTGKAEQEIIDEIKSQSFVTGFIDCYYTYAEVSDATSSKKSYLECIAYDKADNSGMISIPSSNGRNNIEIKDSGVILPKSVADVLGVKVGDTVLINRNHVKVTDISFQYFHPVTYLSKNQFLDLGLEYVSTFMVNVNNESAFLEYMSEQSASLTVFSKSLSKDIHGIFNSIDVFIYIMIGFSLAMAFIILTIMSQNALMEQKRPMSIFRAIGFTIMDISNLWTLQSVSQLLLSALFAIPTGALVAMALFSMCSSTTQIYPFIFSIPVVLLSWLFIFLIILASHGLSLHTIKKWNLADNTRTRE